MKKLFFIILPLLAPQTALAWPPMDEDAERRTSFMFEMITPNEVSQTESPHIELNRYSDRYSLSIGDEEREIPNYLVSQPLRKMNSEQLAAFLQSNYLSIKEGSDGKLSLQEHGRIVGGGPWTAAQGYLAGKWVGEAVVIVSGYAVILGATGVVTVVGGREAGKEFLNHATEQSIPHLFDVAKKISHATGVVGAIGGMMSPAP